MVVSNDPDHECPECGDESEEYERPFECESCGMFFHKLKGL